MSHAKVTFVPAGYTVNGHRLFDEVREYESGACSTHGGADPMRVTIFNDLSFVHAALRVPVELFNTWRKRMLETDDVPCRECRRLVRTSADHAPTCSAEKRVEAARALVASQAADVIIEDPDLEDTKS